MTMYFIDPITGDDDNDGKTKETAWKTISKMINTCDIREDTVTFILYPEIHMQRLEIPLSGKPGKPIIFTGAASHEEIWIDTEDTSAEE